jgi:hypothetical protein
MIFSKKSYSLQYNINILILLAMAFFIISCSNLYNKNITKNSNNYFLVAVGEGKTLEISKQNALQLLSQNIFVNIDNYYNSKEELKNNSFSQNIINNTTLKSNIIFLGLDFFNSTYKNGVHIVYVGVSEKSYLSTIDYFISKLNFEKIDSLTKDLLKQELENANNLYALILYADANNLKINPITLGSLSLLDYINLLKQKNNAQAIIKFDIYPSNATILLNNNKYDPFKEIFLKAGSYSYKVYADGFVSLEENITLNLGDNTNLVLYLQKKLDKPFLIETKIENFSNLSKDLLLDFIKNIANKNQMIISKNTNNKIEIIVNQEEVATLHSTYKSITISVVINIIINDVVKTYKQNISYIFNSNIVNINTIPSAFFFKSIEQNIKQFLATIY